MNKGDDFDDPKATQLRAIALIEPLIPPDAKERVNATIKRFNPPVRGHIRVETGLRLSDEEERGAVPVVVEPGFPTGVARLIDTYQDQTLWRLIMAQAKLGGVVEGLSLLLKSWDEFELWLDLPDIAKGSLSSLERSAQVAIALQVLAVTRKVFDSLKEIHEDILGVYRTGLPSGSRVEIYWMAQALFAAAFGVKIEDLTVVTLAHELAHAYTHLGRDIDGRSWADAGFRRSHPDVVEGLAQFYTAAVAQRLLTRAPEIARAYTKLLEHQSGPYVAHLAWFKPNSKRHGEIVRFAFLRARAQSVVTAPTWLTMLAETEANLSAT